MEKQGTRREKFSALVPRAAGGANGRSLSKAEFLEKVRLSNEACQRGDFAGAVRLYGEALQTDPQNCILYSNRSAAYLKLGQHQAALDDAIKARQLNAKWPKLSDPASSLHFALVEERAPTARHPSDCRPAERAQRSLSQSLPVASGGRHSSWKSPPGDWETGGAFDGPAWIPSSACVIGSIKSCHSPAVGGCVCVLKLAVSLPLTRRRQHGFARTRSEQEC
ncbi:hypothetical protein SKAU_G00010660 [Synaphobranchus kaupii]|uniref:Tetratricopeptide repeat protein 28 n=1 Tax=Synaphobranchus kaupii TaxID=118154 RepID=A0A9Q1GAW2_SYNKA|nr:hypothetical protein SKAU_G00010660 [Synaphobranchus kaupii]